jgi:hypothetical protein
VLSAATAMLLAPSEHSSGMSCATWASIASGPRPPERGRLPARPRRVPSARVPLPDEPSRTCDAVPRPPARADRSGRAPEP